MICADLGKNYEDNLLYLMTLYKPSVIAVEVSRSKE